MQARESNETGQNIEHCSLQRESDKMYMALEEKRIRFEENLLEMEDRRLISYLNNKL